MSDFIQQQWSQYKERMKGSAEYLADGNNELLREFNTEIDSFFEAGDPETYPELLQRMSAGTRVVVEWQDKSSRELASDPSNNPYADADNHETIEQPEKTIAEQAADAKDDAT